MTPEFVKETRCELGFSQSELAQVVGVHAITVSKWETGVRPIASYQAAMVARLWQAASIADKYNLDDWGDRTWSEILATDGAMFTLMALLSRSYER